MQSKILYKSLGSHPVSTAVARYHLIFGEGALLSVAVVLGMSKDEGDPLASGYLIISCFFKNALPDPDLRYFSKLNALYLLENAK